MTCWHPTRPPNHRACNLPPLEAQRGTQNKTIPRSVSQNSRNLIHTTAPISTHIWIATMPTATSAIKMVMRQALGERLSMNICNLESGMETHPCHDVNCHFRNRNGYDHALSSWETSPDEYELESGMEADVCEAEESEVQPEIDVHAYYERMHNDSQQSRRNSTAQAPCCSELWSRTIDKIIRDVDRSHEETMKFIEKHERLLKQADEDLKELSRPIKYSRPRRRYSM